MGVADYCAECVQWYYFCMPHRDGWGGRGGPVTFLFLQWYVRGSWCNFWSPVTFLLGTGFSLYGRPTEDLSLTYSIDGSTPAPVTLHTEDSIDIIENAS